MGLWDRLHQTDSGHAESAPAAAGGTIGEAIADAHAADEAIADAHTAGEVWGRPGRCPQCGGKGYLDRIDMVGRVMEEHCVDCYHRWTVTEAETQPA